MLLVIQGVNQGARFQIDEETVTIGRGIQSKIRVLDTEVSRMHATVHYAHGSFIITDQNSSNGTFVNGAAVSSRELTNGDQIQLGHSIVLFFKTTDDVQKFVAEKVDLLGRQDPSHIVDEVERDADAELLKPSVAVDQSRMAQMLANLRALYRMSEAAVSPSISLDQLLKSILEMTIEVVSADRGCILLADAQTGEVLPQVISHHHRVDPKDKMPVSRTIVDYVLKNGQGVRTSDARRDRRFETAQSILQSGIREAMCVPIQGRYEFMGVIYVDTTRTQDEVILAGGNINTFNEDKLRLLVAIGRQAALAIENNRYQQAFVKAERLAAIGQTITTLSHHIKNILQGVRGGSFLIDRGLKDHNEELIDKGWKIVDKNQNRIYDLVMDMLSFATQRQPALELASLNETVQDVCELMQSRADEYQVQFDWRPASDIPRTMFDPEGIYRAVLNIVLNAIDAVEGMENASIQVQTGFDSLVNELFVEVGDNGPGIPKDKLSVVFEIFESTKGARGTGIGLAVSQKIIGEHGGAITVQSAPNQGCRFRLAWPRMDDESTLA